MMMMMDDADASSLYIRTRGSGGYIGLWLFI